MKRYSVYVLFKNGQDMQFETNTNVKIAQPVEINGGRFIITENKNLINVDYIKKLDMVELRKWYVTIVAGIYLLLSNWVDESEVKKIMDAHEKLKINKEIQQLVDRHIELTNEQIKLSKQLQSDIENTELKNKIDDIAKEKKEVFNKQQELEKILFA